MASTRARIAGWQFLLAHVDAAVAVTGDMDDVTVQATREWQAVAGVPVTGKVDAATWAAAAEALGRLESWAPEQRPALEIGDTGDDVRFLQRRLVEVGYTVEIDGRFRPSTRRAVRSLQYSAGLPESGQMDADTWALLA